MFGFRVCCTLYCICSLHLAGLALSGAWLISIFCCTKHVPRCRQRHVNRRLCQVVNMKWHCPHTYMRQGVSYSHSHMLFNSPLTTLTTQSCRSFATAYHEFSPNPARSQQALYAIQADHQHSSEESSPATCGLKYRCVHSRVIGTAGCSRRLWLGQDLRCLNGDDPCSRYISWYQLQSKQKLA